MSDPFEDRVRAAFKQAPLPAAPETLHRQVAAVTRPAPARSTEPRTSRWLLLPAAAILAVVAGFAIFVIGSRPSVVPVVTSLPSPSSTAAPTSTPTPTATATPAGSPAFVTPLPPAAGTAWTSLTWQPLAAGDPLRQVHQVVRWRTGFIAIGAAVATADGSRTPVWTSVDGAQWFALPESTFGRNAVVGANSVVRQDVPDFCVAAGAPAKVIRRVDQESAEETKQSIIASCAS
jgi:hypothetical protein